jgi:5'-hydroxyaverantin dehydrogenase
MEAETKTAMKSLVLIGSLGGYMEIPLLANYNASKWGARGLFRTLRQPLLGSNVRLNLIAPWITDTPMSQTEVVMFKLVDLSIGRIGDVVNAVGHCATDDQIAGRALAVGPYRILDLRDDAEGMDAAEAMRGFWETELPGFAAAMERLMKQGSPPA